jgi:hypothetical protein
LEFSGEAAPREGPDSHCAVAKRLDCFDLAAESDSPHSRRLNLNSDELGPRRAVVFIEPISVSQSGSILLQFGADGCK